MKKGIIPIAFATFMIVACAGSNDYYTKQEQELPSIIENEWTSVSLPSFEDVEMTRAEIRQSEEGEPKQLALYYAPGKQEERQPYFQDVSNRRDYENEHQVQLLYGSYDDFIGIFVSYQEEKGVVENHFDEELAIQDTPVFYRKQNDGADRYTFNTAQGQYTMTFYAREYGIEDERQEIDAFLQSNKS